MEETKETKESLLGDTCVSGGSGKKKRNPSKKEQAEALKQQANKEFGQGHFAAAIQLYDQAVALDPRNHLLYSNRSVARFNLAQEISKKGDAETKTPSTSEYESPSWSAAMGLYFGSLEDALTCIELEPNFLKAYLRVGAALMALGKYHAAIQTYESTLARFPNEEVVKQALKEALETTAKAEEGYPLYHSFIRLASPHTATPAPRQDVFSKRNSLVVQPKPDARWQFYFGQPPNPRSTADWEPEPTVTPQDPHSSFVPRSEAKQASFRNIGEEWEYAAEEPAPFTRPQPRKPTKKWDKAERTPASTMLQELCDNLRVSQYLPALVEHGVETVDDLLLLPIESVQKIIPTLGHQARVIDWMRRARGKTN